MTIPNAWQDYLETRLMSSHTKSWRRWKRAASCTCERLCSLWVKSVSMSRDEHQAESSMRQAMTQISINPRTILSHPHVTGSWNRRASSASSKVSETLFVFVFDAASSPKSFCFCAFTWNRYHELDIVKSLRDNLTYKTLIEYPVLHVVLRDHWKDYPPKGPGNQTPEHAH